MNAPLADDSVLRLSLYETQWLTLHFVRGPTELTLRMYDNKGALVAYASSGPDRNRPTRVLAATDDDRNWRSNPPLWPLRMDIRFHQGQLLVSRGDVELLRAPYDGVPAEVIFDGHGLIHALQLVRTTSGLPAEPAPRPLAADMARPADMAWKSQLPKGMTLNKLGDGSVALQSQKSQQPGWAAFPLPGGKLGLRELIVEVDGLTPGSDVGLGSLANDPKPKATIGFFRDNNSSGLSFRWNNFGDGSLDYGVDFRGGNGAANAGRHFWLKFIGGCGLKCYTSIDGVHWARMLQPLDSPPSDLTHLAIWCAAGNVPREIRVRRVTLRKLPAVDSLRPAAVIMAQAPTLPIPDFARWQAEVAKRKPAAVGLGDWRRACALETLAAGGAAWTLRPVVDLLADEADALPGSTADHARRLDELALLDDVWGDGAAAGNFIQHYDQLGEQMVLEGKPRPWSTLAPLIVRCPLWCNAQYSLGMERLARAELLETVYSGQINDVRTLLAHMRLWNVQDPLLPWAGDWIVRHGENEPIVDRGALQVDHRHPFIEELNKEGFNLLGDFQSAMASQAYHDACQIITATDGAKSLGLWPDPQDPQLLVSVNGAVDAAIAKNPALRETMIREFGPVGMLQVRQAINEGDSAAVAAVVSRYRGTDAAAQACLWLGDRAMSTGDFARARRLPPGPKNGESADRGPARSARSARRRDAGRRRGPSGHEFGAVGGRADFGGRFRETRRGDAADASVGRRRRIDGRRGAGDGSATQPLRNARNRAARRRTGGQSGRFRQHGPASRSQHSVFPRQPQSPAIPGARRGFAAGLAGHRLGGSPVGICRCRRHGLCQQSFSSGGVRSQAGQARVAKRRRRRSWPNA